MKKTALVLGTVATLAVATVAAPAPAEARNGIGPFIGGLAAGALIAGVASSAYAYDPGYGYYGGPYYGYAPRYVSYYGPGYYGGGWGWGGPRYYYRPRPVYYGGPYYQPWRSSYGYYGGPVFRAGYAAPGWAGRGWHHHHRHGHHRHWRHHW
jgi:hypothetical protein